MFVQQTDIKVNIKFLITNPLWEEFLSDYGIPLTKGL